MSRVVGLLSWYDEAPSWLAACVASFAPHIDALVAVDGPYAAFPHNGKAKSSPEPAEAIQRVCDAVGLELILHALCVAEYCHGALRILHQLQAPTHTQYRSNLRSDVTSLHKLAFRRWIFCY